MDIEDLRKSPFGLSEDEISWVKNKMFNMTANEKIGQLFFLQGFAGGEGILKPALEKIKPGGVFLRPGKKDAILNAHSLCKAESEVPLFLAANIEKGSSGLIKEGTTFGNNMLIGATNNTDLAEEIGNVMCKEIYAVGSNMCFGPVVDINYNWRSSVTNTRCFSSNADTVLKMADAYIEGAKETEVCCAVRQFPGDGVDERDFHTLTSINSMCTQEWEDTYGKIYRGLINKGLKAIIAGNIALPSYVEKINPSAHKYDKLAPSTISTELLNGLLRKEMGYNGLIISDATVMSGFSDVGKRESLLGKSIAAGCDMIIFTRNYDEDYKYMLKAYKDGVITDSRLDEAVMRILGVKASLKLHKQYGVVPKNLFFDYRDHEITARKIAEQGITLVKDEQEILPLQPEKNKTVLLYYLSSDISERKKDDKSTFIKELKKKEQIVEE